MKETRRFPCRPEAVNAARGFVRDALDGQPARVAEAAELMASELATNCVRHAKTDFELTVEVDAEIRVEVCDVGGGRPTMRSPELVEPSGRGLRIVQALSDAWGVTPSAEGKIVWFSLYNSDESSFDASASAARRRSGGAKAGRARASGGQTVGGRPPRTRSRAPWRVRLSDTFTLSA